MKEITLLIKIKRLFFYAGPQTTASLAYMLEPAVFNTVIDQKFGYRRLVKNGGTQPKHGKKSKATESFTKSFDQTPTFLKCYNYRYYYLQTSRKHGRRIAQGYPSLSYLGQGHHRGKFLTHHHSHLCAVKFFHGNSCYLSKKENYQVLFSWDGDVEWYFFQGIVMRNSFILCS